MQFGQFIDHDLSLTPELRDKCEERTEHCEFTNVCQQIRVTDLDPKFGLGTSNNGACIAFSRSLAACPDAEEPLVNRGILSREQINVLTSFIDGSMIYGSCFINPRRACAARVTVVVLCVCVCVSAALICDSRN